MCLKEKKEPNEAAEGVNKPDTDRKYRGRKPQDDSWVEGGRRQLPVPVAQVHPPQNQDSLKNGNSTGGDSNPNKNGQDDLERRDSDGKPIVQGQRGSCRDIKVNDVRNSLKETVKMK